MPKLVYTSIRTLLTLPDSEFSAGMGEVVKHGLIKDRTYYEWLLQNTESIWNRELAVCRRMVAGSNLIKKAVVELDPTEQGERMLLNFGHTLGHAIEKLKGFQLLHGECVALGSMAAMHLSEIRGMVTKEETRQLKDALHAFHLSGSVSGISKEAVIEATKNDKKMEAGVIKFILLKEIGCAYVDRTVTTDEMNLALEYIFD